MNSFKGGADGIFGYTGEEIKRRVEGNYCKELQAYISQILVWVIEPRRIR